MRAVSPAFSANIAAALRVQRVQRVSTVDAAVFRQDGGARVGIAPIAPGGDDDGGMRQRPCAAGVVLWVVLGVVQRRDAAARARLTLAGIEPVVDEDTRPTHLTPADGRLRVGEEGLPAGSIRMYR